MNKKLKKQPKKFTSAEITTETMKWMCREFDIKTTLGQIRNPNPIAFMSWGVHGAGNLKDKALVFHVNGKLFKGLICVTLNVMDTYDIHFIEPHGDARMKDKGYFLVKEELTLKDIYCDQIAQILDNAIETPA